jgi:hypothetical protein
MAIKGFASAIACAAIPEKLVIAVRSAVLGFFRVLTPS